MRSDQHHFGTTYDPTETEGYGTYVSNDSLVNAVAYQAMPTDEWSLFTMMERWKKRLKYVSTSTGPTTIGTGFLILSLHSRFYLIQSMNVSVFMEKYRKLHPNYMKRNCKKTVCRNVFWHYPCLPVLVDGTMDRIKYVFFLEIYAHSHMSIVFSRVNGIFPNRNVRAGLKDRKEEVTVLLSAHT